MSQFYAVFISGGEWEDMKMFDTMEKAKRYVLAMFNSAINRGLRNYYDMDHYHIEEYVYSPEEDQYKCSYKSYALKRPENPITLYEEIKLDQKNIDDFFYII